MNVRTYKGNDNCRRRQLHQKRMKDSVRSVVKCSDVCMAANFIGRRGVNQRRPKVMDQLFGLVCCADLRDKQTDRPMRGAYTERDVSRDRLLETRTPL